jgi:hypothetical protein
LLSWQSKFFNLKLRYLLPKAETSQQSSSSCNLSTNDGDTQSSFPEKQEITRVNATKVNQVAPSPSVDTHKNPFRKTTYPLISNNDGNSSINDQQNIDVPSPYPKLPQPELQPINPFSSSQGNKVVAYSAVLQHRYQQHHPQEQDSINTQCNKPNEEPKGKCLYEDKNDDKDEDEELESGTDNDEEETNKRRQIVKRDDPCLPFESKTHFKSVSYMHRTFIDDLPDSYLEGGNFYNYKKVIGNIKESALTFYREYHLDIEHQLNRLRVTKRDYKRLCPVTRCSLINHKKVGSKLKGQILDYIKEKLPDDRVLLGVARLDIYHIPYESWTILEWYFNPRADVNYRNALAKNLIEGFNLKKRAPYYTNSRFALDAANYFHKHEDSNL